MDTNFIPLGERALQKVLDHVLNYGDEAESHYLEVKSDLNLKAREGIAKIAKFLLGAANRDPIQAARHFQGYAVLVIGVQKGVASGIGRGTEPHDLENSLRPYLGPTFPDFEVARIAVDNEHEVLFIVAPPPQAGQPMFPCHKDFQGDRKLKQETLIDGAIYVRGASNTRPARSGDILRLIERGQGPNKPPINIAIDLIGTVHRVSHLSEAMEALYDLEEQRYAERITESRDRPAVDPFLLKVAGVGEPATPEQQAQYLAEWKSHKEVNMANGREHLLGVALDGLGLQVVSHDRYVDQPHLLLTFENCMVVDHLDRDDADLDKVLEPVVRPRSRYPYMDYALPNIRPANYPVSWENSGNNAEILLTPEAFRPNVPAVFDQDDYVLIARDHTLEEITVTWQLTEAENDEDISRTFTVPLKEAVHAAELIGNTFSNKTFTKRN